MSDAVESYVKGTRAWFQDKEEGWISAEVVDKQVTATHVKLLFVDTLGRDQKYEAALSDVVSSPGGAGAGFDDKVLPPLRNPPLLEQTEDLTNLSYLNEPSVLHAIRSRYSVQQIYTYSGIVLVAVNPFQAVPLYSSSYVQMYAGRRKGELEPHLFAIAEDAYRCMNIDQRDQTIIVSGESGAGKTVSAKYIMRYFATVDDPDRPGKRKASKDGSGMSEVEKQILATNPIMEAFGNAKTTRNDNSSRFGKFTEILFDKTQTIIGARIRTYLLERSRLVYQPATERNYHIFYQLLAGAPASDRGSLGLEDISGFHYLNQGGEAARSIEGVDDAKDFAATQKALSTVGITSERQWQVFGLLAALLHLGNIQITQARTDAVVADGDPALANAVRLLGIDAAEFRKWLVKKQLVTRSEKIVTALNSTQATVVRDSVAKFIYASLFDWLVAVINESLTSEGLEQRVSRFIGVLDIYGFEFFAKNSFEQFCINYANEKLQQEFNAHVFKLEQEEYVAEKIDWTFIDYSDNQPCIDLIEGKLGVLSLLDEESRLPAGSDNSFAQKLYTQLDKPEHAAVFKKPRFGTSAFTIAHYALDVTYESEGFLEKNRDTVPDEHLSLLNSTSNRFLKEVIDRSLALQTAAKEAAPTPAANKRASLAVPPAGAATAMNRRAGASGPGSAARKPTLGSIFKSSLISLMDTIDATNAHYIRCIKPNESKAAWQFEPQMVLGQLRACGVLETIRISCAGYPTRWTYDEFAERYYMLTSSKNWGPEIQSLCSVILAATIKEADRYQCGETKIFFRAGMLAQLEQQRTNRLNYLATLIQKNLRRHVHQKQYRNLRASIIGIQTTWRRVMAQRAAEEARRLKAALDIQRVARGHLQRVRYTRTRRAIVSLQSVLRGQRARRQVREIRSTNAAITLQALFRGLLARRAHHHDVNRVIVAQSFVRRKQARNEFKSLKLEAKSVSHFKEVSYKLENKVVELTQTLQKRTTDNRALSAKLSALENQLASWQAKYEESEGKSKALLAEVEKPTVALPEFEALEATKKELEGKLSQSQKRMQDQETQIQRLTEDFNRQTEEMEKRQKLLNGVHSNGTNEDMSTVSALRSELVTLRDQLSKAVAAQNVARPARDHTSFHLNTGRGITAGTGDEAAAPATNGTATPGMKRKNRRTSITGYPSDPIPDMPSELDRSPNGRPTSMLPGAEGYFRSPGTAQYITNGNDQDPEDEIMRLLENEEALDEDVLIGLIRNLVIPEVSQNIVLAPRDVLFPAHLIALVTNEMWKFGYMRESERFLANVMQSVQHIVMQYHGDDAIALGVFWLSNVHEILSFVCIAESDILQGIGPGSDGAGRDFDWDDYERLVTIVKHDLDSLEYNIYHTFMQETKKRLHKMIIPALIESQSLPGFQTNEGGGRLFNRLLQGGASTPAHTMDEVLALLTRVWKCMQAFFVEHTVVQQVITELLKLIGVTSFNDLLMRRNFCSWKRGIQVQYNVTRLIEWCKSHDIPEGALQLEHIMQATKLLQLKKATKHDVDIIWDVCWVLTPTQIQKLITAYHVNDFENPIGPEILKEIAVRVNANEKGDHLLLPPEVDEAGPYDVPLPREVAGLETYIPSQLLVPTIRRLASLVA